MTAKRNRWLLALGSLVIVAAVGVALPQQSQMAQQMEMMKQKMMNRPGAMQKADNAVQQQKQKAMKAGNYGCCLKNACDFCALKMGECPCGMNAAKDMPVCNECKGGWYAGDGALPGKTADQIKTMPRMGMGM
jgi:hypothetical protein